MFILNIIMPFLIFLIKFLFFFIPLLIGIAFLTLLERKIIASIQQRKGPNVVGFLGLLQPLSDGLKLILKETMLPSFANTNLFLLSPILVFSCSISLWYVIPFTYWNELSDINLNILYIFIISSFSVYGIIFAGWSSNSKYAFLGSLRSAAQMISYEVSLGIIILNVVLFSESLNLINIVESQNKIWYFVPLFPVFILFFISALAETNRTPFDLPEAEGELVAGYNVEYSALTFAMFFLGEYSNMIFMSTLIVLLFFGGWSLPFFNILGETNTFLFIIKFFVFSIKILIFLFLFIWVRATYPRYRYDQLMTLGWKIFLPISLGLLVLNISIYLLFNTFIYKNG
jgi:NADH-quinone oxidoreductase subunit H